MKNSTVICRQCARYGKSVPSSRVSASQLRRAIHNGPQHLPAREAQLASSNRSRDRLRAEPSNRRLASSTSEPLPSQAPASEPFYVTSLGHASPDTERFLLKPNNLFHSFTNSPSRRIRQRAAYMKQHAYCPHPSHQRTRIPYNPVDPENRKPMPGEASVTASPPAHVKYECPDCGIPVACCQEHWEEDFESHLEICDTLKQINEDDHDLHSGRIFKEFEYPGPQRAEEFVVNMSNWDTFLYTRDFNAIDDPRPMRQATRLLTYPMTIATVLHQLSPYNIRQGGRLTYEGLRSFSALRYTLHPPREGQGDSISAIRARPPPNRLFILGARAESSLPRDVWIQLIHCFPRSQFHLIFIGPESMANREREFPLPERTPRNPFGGVIEDRLGHQLKITTFVDYYHTMHQANYFQPFDPYFDAFVLFHPGLGHPASSHEWTETIPQLLETKCPVICTGYTEWDLERDRDWVEKTVGGEYDVLLEPGENIFRSLRWDLNDLDPGDITCGNWGLWAFRGKRYEATMGAEGSRFEEG